MIKYDRYTFAVIKDTMTVGPKNIDIMYIFIRRGGIMQHCVTGNHHYSRDLVQGGMEVPCQLNLLGLGKELKRSFATLQEIYQLKQLQTS